MSINPALVEKDYWITWALRAIFKAEIGKDVVFKGGTSLSKCYSMINRFSEDVDLVVLRHEGETDSKLKAKLKAIGKAVESNLPEVELENITRKMGMNRKTAHTFPKQFSVTNNQIRDCIILEATWLGYYEPFTYKNICSFAGELMQKSGQVDLVEQYGMQPFEIRVLEPIRTLCEKIMSLVRFSYTENPIRDLRMKIRHTYDLNQLLHQDEFLAFFNSSEFDKMLLKVAQDDVKSFRNNNLWLNNHPSKALIFKEIEIVWPQLESIYSNEFKNLVYGPFPKAFEIFETLKLIKERLLPITWTIQL